MEKKILVIMVSLVLAAVILVAAVMIAAGGFARSGGFTKLFDRLENNEDTTYYQHLSLPDSWQVDDIKRASDTIVDMSFHPDGHGYSTTLYFVYTGEKWNNPSRGTHFFVPDTSSDGYLEVANGLFSIVIWSATNLSAKYDVGDTITVETQIVTNVNNFLAFDSEWHLAGAL